MTPSTIRLRDRLSEAPADGAVVDPPVAGGLRRPAGGVVGDPDVVEAPLAALDQGQSDEDHRGEGGQEAERERGKSRA
ncbi:MAG: hypothetical protein QOH12_1022 [Solirubrobacteraceae bacterium]|jgi:hypothetical protein|nr:hypothetical protein [Solirubrobacteraceae bacterium]